jgi:hypothetical protein
MERYKQTNEQPSEDPRPPTWEQAPRRGVGNPHFAWPTSDLLPLTEATHKQQADHVADEQCL